MIFLALGKRFSNDLVDRFPNLPDPGPDQSLVTKTKIKNLFLLYLLTLRLTLLCRETIRAARGFNHYWSAKWLCTNLASASVSLTDTTPARFIKRLAALKYFFWAISSSLFLLGKNLSSCWIYFSISRTKFSKLIYIIGDRDPESIIRSWTRPACLPVGRDDEVMKTSSVQDDAIKTSHWNRGLSVWPSIGGEAVMKWVKSLWAGSCLKFLISDPESSSGWRN